MAIEKELLGRLLAGRDPSEVFFRDGLLDDLKALEEFGAGYWGQRYQTIALSWRRRA